jgi:site-specific recombinase XerD
MPTHSQSCQKNRQNTQNYTTLYLDDVAMKYLKDYIASRNGSNNPNEPLFTQSLTTKPMSDEAVRATIKRIKSNAKIDRRIYPHLFRKTTATNIVKRGGSVHDAGEYLGHKDQSVTGKHYSYISEEHTRNIFEKYVATV